MVNRFHRRALRLEGSAGVFSIFLFSVFCFAFVLYHRGFAIVVFKTRLCNCVLRTVFCKLCFANSCFAILFPDKVYSVGFSQRSKRGDTGNERKRDRTKPPGAAGQMWHRHSAYIGDDVSTLPLLAVFACLR